MATIPKWIIFVGIVGSTWFFGQEVWFLSFGGMEWDASWHWVFITTFIVAFLFYGLLFGLKGNKIDSDK